MNKKMGVTPQVAGSWRRLSRRRRTGDEGCGAAMDPRASAKIAEQKLGTTGIAGGIATLMLIISLSAAAAAPLRKPAARPKAETPAAAVTPTPDPATPAPAPPTEEAAVPSGPKTWALLVGVSKYQNPAIVSLKYPSSDATAIRDALVDRQLGSLPAGNVRLLTDEQATAANILGSVDEFLKPNVQPGDQVILFLAGHGVAKGVGLEAKSYFLSTDVKGVTTASLEESAVNLKTLSARLGELPAAQFVVFVDACREDPTPGRGIKGNPMSDIMSRGIQIVPRDTSRPSSSASFFACSIGQRAFEDPSLNHGVFTYWILDAIRTAAVPRKPDGAVDLGVLSGYVRQAVTDWAKKTSDRGDFEVEQTPELVTSQLNEPIVLMHVKRPLPDATLPAPPPTLTVASFPEGAQVTVDGERVGAAPITASLPRSGQHTLKIEAPGYSPVERSITALDGYGLQIAATLQPGARGVGSAPDKGAADLYQRALDAETQQQWEVAEAGYDLVAKADPKFVPAYEHLSDLRLRRGKTREAIGTLIDLVKQAPTAHSYALLSRAYSAFAVEAGEEDTEGASAKAAEPARKGGLLGSVLRRKIKKEEPKVENGAFVLPIENKDAAAMAHRAAEEAVQRDRASAEAQLALGFSLVATDQDGKNQSEAMAAFGKAVLLQPKDAATHFGLGYGIRTFAVAIKEGPARKAELERAVVALKEALALRPAYYEAHRELAFCYHQMEDLPAARHEYEQANANRGAASDEDEVAAVNLSLASIHKQEAESTTGDTRRDKLAASDGYVADAKETAPNLARALRILNRVRIGPRVIDFLPAEVRNVRALPGNVRGKIDSKIRNPLGRFR
jgi:tetratricopeptide (TPR) repeat protein